jgi:GH43 family beta-xylosidase
MKIKTTILLFLWLFCIGTAFTQKTFTNPLLPSGADPWSIYKNNRYYYMHTLGDRLVIWKTKSIAKLGEAKSKTIFQPPSGLPYSKGLWAPELHFIQNKWYVYFAADSGRNEGHRLWVLENAAKNPMKGKWILKGQLKDSTNKWAIDGSIFQHNGQLYLIWSGWEGDRNGQQDIYISKMKDPLTLEGKRVRLSSPTFAWERHGNLNDPDNPPHVAVNEGPQFLQHNNRLFIIYSASGCWTDNYTLGMLSTSSNSNMLDSAAWVKSPEPVFKGSVANSVYAPGHNSFFKSPDGSEDWILYHANSKPNQGCGRFRSPRAQPFTWKADGTPEFGVPVKEGEELEVPSNEKSKKKQRLLAESIQ